MYLGKIITGQRNLSFWYNVYILSENKYRLKKFGFLVQCLHSIFKNQVLVFLKRSNVYIHSLPSVKLPLDSSLTLPHNIGMKFKKKPRKKSLMVSPPSSPPIEEEEKQTLYPVFKNGMIRYYNEKTGEVVKTGKFRSSELEIYNEDKVNVLLQHISNAIPFKEALNLSGITYSTYLFWRKNTPDLESRIKKARALRAEALTEGMFEDDILPMMSKKIHDINLAEASVYEKRLKLMKTKQSVFKAYRDIEGDYVDTQKTGTNVNVAAAIKIEIPDKVVNMVEDNFRPFVKGERLHLAAPSDEVVEFETELKEM